MTSAVPKAQNAGRRGPSGETPGGETPGGETKGPQCTAEPLRAAAADDERVRIDHALRTALTAILGFSEVIGQEMFGPVGNPQYRQYAKDINKTGKQLMAFLGKAEQLPGAKADEARRPYQVCHVPTALAEARRLASKLARDASVTLAVDVPETLPLLKMDQRALQQIVLTLILNAIRASDPGDLVSIVPDVTLAGEFRLTVQSQLGSLPGGQPLPPTQPEETQAEEPKATDPALANLPTRLGLDIPKSLVELHGGRLEVHCIPEFGLRATARFPKAWVIEPAGGPKVPLGA
ncbi:MAG: HAMP domain-containing histidine kinase [Kiloniellales bacterium]|nr:HAMP domain-containing histidine kinase [Kiloniellales bacterium]